MTPEIRQAVEGLYAAFADARRPSCIDMSPVKDPADFALLLSVPLRELTAEQLWHYSFSLFNTVGGISDFDYFFPRIVDLASEPRPLFGFQALEVEVVFKKPAMAGWPEKWRRDRRDAFQAYIDAMIASWTTTVTDVDVWLCAFSYCLPDVEKHLEVLLSGSVPANQNLISFYEANRESLVKHRLGNSFWDRSKGTHARTVAWLWREDVQLRIQQLQASGFAGTEG